MRLGRARLVLRLGGLLCATHLGTDALQLGNLAALPSARARSAPLSCVEGRIDISDLGLTMDDLDKALPKDFAAGVTSEGYESTSTLTEDRGLRWRESAARIEIELSIPGLRGQPADSIAMSVTEDTAAVLGFGRVVWDVVLRGRIVPESARVEVVAPELGGVPLLKLGVDKAAVGGEMWGGFIRSIGVDSLLQ